MPIYEYQCKACGDVQEVMQKMTDPAPTDCVACHVGPMHKMVSKTAFILKGNGWYVTDFRTKDKGTAGGSVPSVADVESTIAKDKKADSSSPSSTSSSDTSSSSSPAPAASPAAKSDSPKA